MDGVHQMRVIDFMRLRSKYGEFIDDAVHDTLGADYFSYLPKPPSVKDVSVTTGGNGAFRSGTVQLFVTFVINGNESNIAWSSPLYYCHGVSDGKDSNGHYITMPAGCSEHQTGLSCDITDVYREIKNSEIENTDTYKWLLEHCAEYGFIHRFPSGKEDVTGVMYEPFHFRYVGIEAARYIEDNGLCLEEFVELYSGSASEAEAEPTPSPAA